MDLGRENRLGPVRRLLRRKRGTYLFRASITLWEGRDDAIIAALECAQGSLADAARELMRHGAQSPSETPAGLESEIDTSGWALEL